MAISIEIYESDSDIRARGGMLPVEEMPLLKTTTFAAAGEKTFEAATKLITVASFADTAVCIVRLATESDPVVAGLDKSFRLASGQQKSFRLPKEAVASDYEIAVGPA